MRMGVAMRCGGIGWGWAARLNVKSQRLIAAAKGRGLRLATYLIDWAVL